MSQYTKEKYEEFALRAKEFIERNPKASRKRIADYAGVSAGTLIRLQDKYDFKMPEAMSPQQTRKSSKLGNNTGWVK